MEEKTFQKVNETTIRRIKQPPTPPAEVDDFTLEYLLKQKVDIQAQKDRENAETDKQLAEVDELIAQCEEKGIKTKAEVQNAEQGIE